MKKYILQCFVYLLISNTALLAQNWEYSASLLGNGLRPVYTTIDDDKNFYSLSEFTDTVYIDNDYIISNGGKDLLFVKYDSQGNLKWYKHIKGNSNINPGGIAVNNLNEITITGYFLNKIFLNDTDSLISSGGNDFFTASYDSEGILLNYLHLGKGIGTSQIKDLKIDNNNNLIICGLYLDTLFLDANNKVDTLLGLTTVAYSFIAKLDNSGNLLWSKSIVQSNSQSRTVNISIDNTGYYFGGYVVGNVNLDIGSISSINGLADVYYYKTDFAGNGSWVRKISGLGSESIASITTDDYNNLYVLGSYTSSELTIDSTAAYQTTYSGNIGGWDTFIGKFNRSGILQWFITKGGTLLDAYNDISISGDIIYASGTFTDKIIFNNDTLNSGSTSNQDVFLAALNSIGDPISGISIKGQGNELDAGVLVNSDVDVDAYIAGYYKSNEITIGDSVYSNLVNGQSQFFAKYTHPFHAAFTNENYISCSGQSDGMLTITPYFGVPPYSYSWTKDGSPIVATDSIATGLDAGLYRVSVTDNRDSVAIAQVTLNNPATLNISSSVTEVTCFNGIDGAIDLTVTGGNNNYEYNWAGGTGLNPTEQDQSGLYAADYSVTVTDIKGCTASETIAVTQPDPITFGETEIISTNSDVDTGRINLVLSGGTAPYTDFSWEGPEGYTSIDDTITGLSGGNYSITVTDDNSCLADTTFLVPNDSLFIGYMTTVDDITCGDLTNGQASVSSNRDTIQGLLFSYIWIDMEDSTQVGSNQASITGLDSSLYRVYIIDAINVDTTFVEFEINKPQILNAISIAVNPTCSGNDDGFINAIISGGTLPYTYDWSNGSTNEDLTDIQANGTYTLTVTDANNCNATTSKTLTDPAVMDISIDKTDPLCHNEQSGEATANVTGGVFPYNYSWNDPGFQSTQTADDLFAGNYEVTVTDQNGCTIMSSVTLNNPTPVSIVHIDSVDISCYGADDGWIKISATGGSGSYTYNWSHLGLGIDSVGGLSEGSYTVTVNDVNDCTPIVDMMTINEPTEIIVNIDTVDNICFGQNNGQITVTPSGGSGSFDYTWGHTSSNTGALTNLAAGTYNLTLSDGSCPDLFYDIPVDEPEEIIVSIDTIDISCNNAQDGEIALYTTGGTGTYTYSWSHDATTEDTISILSGGTYTVSVNDGACPDKVLNIPVNEPAIFIADIDTTAASCYNITDGSITVTPSGGSGNYSYTWSHTTDNVNSLVDLASASYDVTISDGSCPDIAANIFVDQPAALVFDIDTTDVSCQGYSDGAIAVNVTGGSENYTYTWSHTASDISELGGLSGGTYNLTVSDGACPDSAFSIPVGEPEEFIVSLDKQDVSCYNAGDGSIQVNISGGSESYDITWAHTTNKVTSLDNLEAGNYSITVDDGDCPVKSEAVEITQPGEFLVSGYDTVNITAIGARDGKITIHVVGGVEPYRYLISGETIAQLDSVFNNLDVGKYVVAINDNNNCGPIYTDSIEILEPTIGIINYWEENTVSYYPNPADEKISIEINNLKTKSVNLKVVNSMGSLLLNERIETPNKQNIIELRTEHLSQGIYFILIDNVRLKTPLIVK